MSIVIFAFLLFLTTGYLFMRSSHKPGFVRLVFRGVLGIVFVCSGLGKVSHLAPHGFPSLIGPVRLEALLAPHKLALFAQFVGYSQIAIGLLMFSRRLYLLGAIMLFPMLLCIFVVTLSMEFRGTPYIVFILILIDIILIASNWHRLEFILFDTDQDIAQTKIQASFSRAELFWFLGFIFVLFGAAFIHEANIAARYSVYLGVLFLITAGFFYRRLINRKSFEEDRG